MNTVDGIGFSSLGATALGNASAAQSVELEAADWFSPSLASSNHAISATSNFEAGASVDQMAQQIISHICSPEGT